MNTLNMLLVWAVSNPDQIAFAAAALTAVVAWVRNLAVANHAERLAMLRDVAASAGGKIMLEVVRLAPDEDIKRFISRRIQEEALHYSQEFAKTGSKVDLTPLKMVGMISGQLGQNPAFTQILESQNWFNSQRPGV